MRERADLLTTVPGVSDVVAQVVISEIGVEMGRFPTAGHLLSWAGLCPRNDASAGKRRSTHIRDGAPWLKTTLVQAAWCAVRTKGTYLRAQFQRLKSRRGPKKAIVAVTASMLTAMYYMLRDGVEYREFGADYFERRDKQKVGTAQQSRPVQAGRALLLRVLHPRAHQRALLLVPRLRPILRERAEGPGRAQCVPAIKSPGIKDLRVQCTQEALVPFVPADGTSPESRRVMKYPPYGRPFQPPS
jgi:transposase